MCVAPITLQDGKQIGCRKCKQCKRQIINDWAGRIIAESKTSAYTYFLTLTYGRDENGNSDHIRAAVLTYSDAQKYLKLLRKDYKRIRFFIVGEYGKEKGRAHWHLILYLNEPLKFKDETKQLTVEPVFDKECVNQGQWKHGFTHIRKFNVQDAFYCAKYVFKDMSDELKNVTYQPSLKPPLGTKWFQRLAQKYVEQGLAPQTTDYRHPEARTRNGNPIRFKMRNKTLENFLNWYVAEWRSAQPWAHVPESELVYEHLDKIAKEEESREEFERVEKAHRRLIQTRKEMEQKGYGEVEDAPVRRHPQNWKCAPKYVYIEGVAYAFDVDAILDPTSKAANAFANAPERNTFHNTDGPEIPF